MMEHWYSFLYGYGVGGILFGVGIVLGLRKSVLKLDRPADRRLLMALVGTWLLYAGVHGVWNVLAIRSW